MKFEFEDAIQDVNCDADLFYDLTAGGYIDPIALLKDKDLGKKVADAANLVAAFLDAIVEHHDC
jgi:hypothetical protein